MGSEELMIIQNPVVFTDKELKFKQMLASVALKSQCKFESSNDVILQMDSCLLSQGATSSNF